MALFTLSTQENRVTARGLMVSRSISHYRILNKLGEGGMGEVYLAQDTRLDRKVAVKLLGEEFNRNEDRLRRFIAEAKAASALNHPNIITVYDIGEAEGGSHFIATEFIEGETLRHHTETSRLKTREVLDIVVQVASALAAAHQAGIIHRDIKPENIMLRPDGYVKVLDFGLAKLTEKQPLTADSQAGTIARKETDPGTVMGTVQYMSPEQARGKVVDARTDIFSLGIVLYELVAGRAPFAGESSTDVLAAILEREPPPLARYADGIPQELQRIVSKCLRKERDERYQTMKDALLDLKELRDELALEAKLERSIRPATSNINNQQTLIVEGEITKDRAAQATSAASAQTTSSAEYLVSEIRQHKRGVAIVLLGLLMAASGLAYLYFSNRSSSARQIESIAVMPFVNESGNPEVEYLSDGMTETLINSLSQIPNLSVKARSSVFRYKGKEVDPKKIAAELNVQAILTGRVVQRGEQITLNLELIDAETENTLWGNKYERKSSDLVSLQSEIARDVSSKLKSKLSGADAAKVEKTYTANPEAYQLYLKGKFFWNKRTGEALRQAAAFYNQAIEKDPNYALAYSGLAETYVLFSSYDVAPATDSMPQAKAAAMQALAIDEQLAEAHTALGFYLSNYEWDRDGSDKEYRRAIELKPNYATAHHWFGADLSNVKRSDESLVELRRAEELDPLSPIIGTNLGDMLVYVRSYDEAIAQYKRTLVRDPNFAYGHRALGWAYGLKGMYQEAIAETRTAIELNNGSSAKGYLGLWLAKSGKRDEAVKLLSELKQETIRDYVQSYTFALIYLGLGDKEEALNYLEKHMWSRAETANAYAVAPELDDLRSEPRFKEMLKRMNLPE
jgi:serine/threonine-protein kinase